MSETILNQGNNDPLQDAKAFMAQLAGSWQETGKLPPRSSEIDKLMK